MLKTQSKPTSRSFSFSLRTFLVAISLLAILLYWNQRPIVKTQRLSADPFYGNSITSGTMRTWSDGSPERIEYRVFRRTNFIHPVQHGVTRVFDTSDRLLEEQSWESGRQRSTVIYGRDDQGVLRVQGNLVGGQPDGLWKWWLRTEANSRPQSWTVTSNFFAPRPMDHLFIDATLVSESDSDASLSLAWGRGRREKVTRKQLGISEGEAQRLLSLPVKKDDAPDHTFLFEAGWLTEVDGESVAGFFNRIPRTGAIGDAIKKSLNALLKARYDGSPFTTPLLPQGIRTEWPVNLRVSAEIHDLPHVAILFLLCKERGFVLDYRHGSICITTKKQVDAWSDTTGLAAVPNAGPLNRALSQIANVPKFPGASISLDTINQQLGTEVQLEIPDSRPSNSFGNGFDFGFAGSPSYEFYVSERDAAFPMTYRDLIGQILHSNDLTCTISGNHIIIDDGSED